MRETSVDCYRMVCEQGLLKKIRLSVYRDIYENPNTSQMETFERLKSQYSQHSITPRFAELEKMGAICAPDKKQCSITNVRVLAWEITGNLPKRLPKRESKDLIIKRLLKKEQLLNLIIKRHDDQIYPSSGDNCDYGTYLIPVIEGVRRQVNDLDLKHKSKHPSNQ